MSDVILEVNDIHAFIGQFHILEGVSVTVRRGEITVLLGRNGAGKTTTLRSILGLVQVRSGEIRFNERHLRGMRPFKVAQLGIGYVPEHRAIFRGLSVEENLKIAERKPGDLARRRDFIYSIFPDLQRLSHLGGGQLSGGQQQMLSIARALVADNSLLLIDEPSEGLAPVLIEQMMAAIRKLSSHITVLLVEQNFRMASQLADRFVIIEEGKSVLDGAMSTLIGNETLINRYLGAA
jgi:branched-chain amino acid transport system ATP-binding protein